MTNQFASIPSLDLDSVTGGYSSDVQRYIDCHNTAVRQFNTKKSNYESTTPWYDQTTQALDNFGRELQQAHAKCIVNHPLQLDTSGF